MKNKFCYIICLVGLISLWGCDDFLTKLPESSYSEAGAYQNQADFEYAIAGVYAAQQDLYQSNSCWFRLMIARSDDTRSGATYTYGIDTFSDSDNISDMANAWAIFYRMITRCNIILDKIEAIHFDDNNLKSYIKGEAYALRAWAYYTLGWMFGGVPLLEHQLSMEDVMTIPRSTQEETFEFAANDFKNAISLLPTSWKGTNVGRVTKYAASGILARMYMFQSKFSEAKPYLKEIIDSKLYAMEENYKDCFTDSHDNGKERVWEVQFTGNMSGEGQRFSTGMLPEGYKDGVLIPFSGYSSAMTVSLAMVDAYEEGDLRKDISIVSNIMVNGVLESKYHYILKYCHYDAYTPQDQGDWANNLPILRYTDVKMMYAECLNEEGYIADGEAFSILNEVRERAGLLPLTPELVPNQQAYREAMIKERRVEFAFEGLRWIDLVRWGIAQKVINKHLLAEDEGEGRYQMDGEYREIFAIPNDEIIRYNNVNVMWQNPGY